MSRTTVSLDDAREIREIEKRVGMALINGITQAGLSFTNNTEATVMGTLAFAGKVVGLTTKAPDMPYEVRIEGIANALMTVAESAREVWDQPETKWDNHETAQFYRDVLTKALELVNDQYNDA